MNGERTAVGQRYGLRRENFILDPLTDTDCFARDDIKTAAIAESLDIDLVTNLAPKRLVWGPYGGGKTHTLMRTMRELQQLTQIHPVRIECPDLSKRSRFHDLYREGIMRGLGQDFIVRLIEDAVQSVGLARRDELLQRLKTKFGDEELAKAAIRIIDPNFDQLRLWRWVSGVAMSRQDLDDLGQTQDLTETEAARLAELVCVLGRLVREIRGQTLVLVLDEMERLRSIGPETITTFVSGFTRLVDPNQTFVSVLIGASAAVESEMVDVFGAGGPVTSRIGADAQIQIPSLDEADVNKFIKGVIAYVRDPQANLDALIAVASKTTNESVNPEFFPFTEDALDALKSHLTQIMTPREITMKMTRALGRAYRADRPAITSDCVS
jgi:Cdc6-like AAA superfamily ATPase